MTDERQGDDLWAALRRMPRGSGVVFRHYATAASERRQMFARVVRIARMRRLVVVRAGDWCGPGAVGVHNRRGRGLRTASAHYRAEAVEAVRRGAMLVFVSPVFATRSHRGAAVLGVEGAERIALGLRIPAIALGGLNATRFRELNEFYGWAAIDAWASEVKDARRGKAASSVLAMRGRPGCR